MEGTADVDQPAEFVDSSDRHTVKRVITLKNGEQNTELGLGGLEKVTTKT